MIITVIYVHVVLAWDSPVAIHVHVQWNLSYWTLGIEDAIEKNLHTYTRL